MSNFVHDAIMTEYEKKRAAARESLLKRRLEIYEALPVIKEIDGEMARIGLEFNMKVLKGSLSHGKAAAELGNTLSSLASKKKRILAANGYPEDHLEMAFACERCKDTGYINTGSDTVKCRCYLQQTVDKLFAHSNLKIERNNSFEYFDESLYSDVADESRYGMRISPRENIRIIKDRCLDFISDFTNNEGRSLFFSGPAGTGKTFMCNCVAVELIRHGNTVLYQTSPSLFSTIAEYKFKSHKDAYAAESDDSLYRQIFEVELLIIDDLGTESPSAARYAELLTILDTRRLNNLSRPCKTIISTNIGIKELYEYYDERNASRIIGGFDMFKFAGDDIRMILRRSTSSGSH